MGRIAIVVGVLLWTAACGEDKSGSAGAGEQGSVESGPEGEVKATLADWCQAQTDGDKEAYSAFYIEGFEGVKRSKKKKKKTYSLKGWLKDRGRMFKKPLHVDCRNPAVTLKEGDAEASVTFEQYWRSPTYADQGDKRLDLKKTPDGWRLIGEEMLTSTTWDTKTFRDGSPAPKASFKTDEIKVKVPESLRMMTTKDGPPCYRKCLKKKPKNWREVITTNHDPIRYPSKDGCEKYCVELYGNFE